MAESTGRLRQGLPGRPGAPEKGGHLSRHGPEPCPQLSTVPPPGRSLGMGGLAPAAPPEQESGNCGPHPRTSEDTSQTQRVGPYHPVRTTADRGRVELGPNLSPAFLTHLGLQNSLPLPQFTGSSSGGDSQSCRHPFASLPQGSSSATAKRWGSGASRALLLPRGGRLGPGRAPYTSSLQRSCTSYREEGEKEDTLKSHPLGSWIS